MNILTEEELNKIEDNLKCDLDYNGIKELYSLTESHRLLFSANAELSFKLLKYENSDMSLHNENICSPEQLKRIKELM